MMTDEELAAIRARVDAATPGPWYWADWNKVDQGDPDDVSEEAVLVHDYVNAGEVDILPFDGKSPWHDRGTADPEVRYQPNAVFIAHAREDIPALLDECESLRAEVERLQAERNQLFDERTEMRGVLYDVAITDPFHAVNIGKGGGFRCHHCAAWSPIGLQSHHNTTCEWVKARALLAQTETPQQPIASPHENGKQQLKKG